jgi:nicotinic acid mononucleotide adenylyltransferase
MIPFPVSQPDLITQYAPRDAVYFMSICSEWDEERCQILQRLGLETEVLWRKIEEERGITGTEIRQLIAEGLEWQQHVPKTVSEYIIEHGIDKRIQALNHMFE